MSAETNEPAPTEARSQAYDAERATYLDAVRDLFGGYKKRSFEFSMLAPGQKVLDVGCGAGDDALLLTRIVGPGGHVTGLDHQAPMVEEATRRAKEAGLAATFVQGDASQLPFDPDTFDRTRCDRVLQHIQDPLNALKEMVRVTVPKGWVVALDTDWASVLIDSDDGVLTQTIVQHASSLQVQGQVGRQLYRLAGEVGLVERDVLAETVVIRSWPVAKFILGLDVFAQKAEADGAINPGGAEAWMAEMGRRDDQEMFFCAVTGFGVRGQKPS